MFIILNPKPHTPAGLYQTLYFALVATPLQRPLTELTWLGVVSACRAQVAATASLSPGTPLTLGSFFYPIVNSDPFVTLDTFARLLGPASLSARTPLPSALDRR